MTHDLTHNRDANDSRVILPPKAFVLGTTAFFAVIAISWIISGQPLDSIWLQQLFLCPFMGFCSAGFSARVFPSHAHRRLQFASAAALTAVVIASLATGLPLHAALIDSPVATLIIGGGALTVLYHIMLGVLRLMVDAWTACVRLFQRVRVAL